MYRCNETGILKESFSFLIFLGGLRDGFCAKKALLGEKNPQTITGKDD